MVESKRPRRDLEQVQIAPTTEVKVTDSESEPETTASIESGESDGHVTTESSSSEEEEEVEKVALPNLFHLPAPPDGCKFVAHTKPRLLHYVDIHALPYLPAVQKAGDNSLRRT